LSPLKTNEQTIYQNTFLVKPSGKTMNDQRKPPIAFIPRPRETSPSNSSTTPGSSSSGTKPSTPLLPTPNLRSPPVIKNILVFRIWPPHNPRHPSNIQNEPAHSPEPNTTPLAEEVTDTLTLGVSEIAHIPNPTPFQPEPCLPSALHHIHEQVLGESSQGRSLLPQRITPAAAPPPPPCALSRSGPTQTMALPPKPVSLQGTAPTIFTGERSLSETFMQDFKIYKIMNPLADVMKQPYARVAMALSLI
jgi:hypothetical protein